MSNGRTKDLPGFDRCAGFVASPADLYPGANGMTGVVSDFPPSARGKAAPGTEALAAGRSVNRLYGRDHELGLLTGLLSRDAGGALVVRGEPGIGKSALLAAVIARAREQGIRVLTAVGVQSEARLAFAGLHQLLRPVLQRAALLGAWSSRSSSTAVLVPPAWRSTRPRPKACVSCPSPCRCSACPRRVTPLVTAERSLLGPGSSIVSSRTHSAGRTPPPCATVTTFPGQAGPSAGSVLGSSPSPRPPRPTLAPHSARRCC